MPDTTSTYFGMLETGSHPDEVHLVVGGYHYYLDTDDLLMHPNSYFAHMLKDEWNKDKTAVITLDRNGRVFRNVSYYLFSGYMDPNRKPILDLDMLLTLRTEADFYGLPELVRMCGDRIMYNIDRMISNEQNVGLRCDCMRKSEEKSTDALVKAMDIFRLPTIATSRVENLAILWGDERKIHVSANRQKVFIYKPEGYCTTRIPTSTSNGTFLYIFNSEHTGGRITAKVNGEEVSIEKPGECMALLPGCSYSVETVTSGYLVLFECYVTLHCYDRDDECNYSETGANGCEVDDQGGNIQENTGSCGSAADNAEESGSAMDGVDDGEEDDYDSIYTRASEINTCVESKEQPLVWQVCDSYSTEITPERSAALTQAINTALETYAGVIICLSSYYPTGHSSNKNRRCETDPALLRRFDAKLHTHLSSFYEITVVSVAVNAAKNNMQLSAHVLDFPQDSDLRLKVVAPMQSATLDRAWGETMLLTGLLCFARG
eukprot:gene9739-11445_t